MERSTVRGIYTLIFHLAYGIDRVPGLYGITILGFKRDGTVNLLQQLFSIPVCLYSMHWQLFACLGELPDEGLNTVVDITMEAFAVRRSVHAMTRDNHMGHLEGVTPPGWK